MDDHILSLMIWIGSVTGYVSPPVSPIVQYITEDQIAMLYCGNVQEKCKIGGLYLWGSNKVYINKDMSADGKEVVLVHELTHYMQAREHKYAAGTCQDNMLRELQAYSVEKKYAALYYPKISHKLVTPAEINLDLCHKKQ